MTIKISYEDEMQQLKTIEIPVSFTVEEAMDIIDDFPVDPEAESEGGLAWYFWLIIAFAGIAVVVVIIVVIKKKKKKHAQAIPDTFDWGDSADNAKAEVTADEKK